MNFEGGGLGGPKILDDEFLRVLSLHLTRCAGHLTGSLTGALTGHEVLGHESLGPPLDEPSESAEVPHTLLSRARCCLATSGLNLNRAFDLLGVVGDQLPDKLVSKKN